MFTFLKNKKDWLKYKKTQEIRVSNFPFHHINAPKTFPTLVISALDHSCGTYYFKHFFVEKEDAKKLFEYV